MTQESNPAALRRIISDCAAAIGNGSAVSPDCSLEFMRLIPDEIRLHVARLTTERDAALDSLREAGEMVARLEAEIDAFAGRMGAGTDS